MGNVPRQSVGIRSSRTMRSTELGERAGPRLRELAAPRPEGVRRRDSLNLGPTLLPSPVLLRNGGLGAIVVVVDINQNGGKFLGQNQFNRLQIVQFECPKYINPWPVSHSLF